MAEKLAGREANSGELYLTVQLVIGEPGALVIYRSAWTPK